MQYVGLIGHTQGNTTTDGGREGRGGGERAEMGWRWERVLGGGATFGVAGARGSAVGVVAQESGAAADPEGGGVRRRELHHRDGVLVVQVIPVGPATNGRRTRALGDLVSQ